MLLEQISALAIKVPRTSYEGSVLVVDPTSRSELFSFIDVHKRTHICFACGKQVRGGGGLAVINTR